MKRLLLFLVLLTAFTSCKMVKELFLGPEVFNEEVTAANQVMVCLVRELIVRHEQGAPEPEKDAPKYKKGVLNPGDEVVYLGQKSNEEERFYPETFPKKPKRKGFWYKVCFKVKKGRYKGSVWIGWVHGGGMAFKPQQQILPSENQGNQPERYAVLVGVSDYSDEMNARGARDLNYCDDDVNSMYQFLRSGNVPDSHIAKLIDEEATIENILAKCNEIYAKAGPKAIIIFYFSGHGSSNQFIAYDGALRHDEIKNILKLSTAARKLVVADACYSGSIIPEIAQSEDEYFDSFRKEEYGIAFFMSSRSDQTSIEANGHGYFTKSVIKGLDSCTANKNGDKVIDIEELTYFVKEDMKDIEGQTPMCGGTYDHQMPIVVSCGADEEGYSDNE
jgi:hypothetical protein